MLLHELIERQANTRPKATALFFKRQAISYAQLHGRVEKWAAVLQARGVKAGDTFGLVLRNSPEFVMTFFALMRLGARAVPVNFLLKAEEIAFIFGDAGVVGVLTQPAFLGAVLEARKKLPNLRDVVVTGFPPRAMGEGGKATDERSQTKGDGREAEQEDREALRNRAVLYFEELISADFPPASVPSPLDPQDVAMIIYTSGTTGKPKGAMLTHRNFIANAEKCIAMVKLSSKDTFLCLLPMFHSFAWTVCVVLPLYLGCSIVVIESLQPFGEVIKQIVRHRASIFVGVPPIFAALLRLPFWWPMRWINPVRVCISGAAALPSAVHKKFEGKFGIPLMEGYGLTEASPVVTLNPQKRRIAGSIGKALPGVELRIVDSSGKDLPQGEVGEICVKGDNVMAGYYHQEAATRDAFLDDARLWLRTGDVGHRDTEGYLYISDRKKDLIIVKGLNVYPKEVEDVLLAHPAVQEAAVIGLQDESGDEVIRAYVTLKEGQTVEKQELLKLCRSRLAPYKCPRDLDIRKDLPKNTLGKILKRTLREELRAMDARRPGLSS